MKTKLLLRAVKPMLLLLLSSQLLHAQQLKLGSNPTVVQKTALLELDSRNQGLLLTRISDTTTANMQGAPDGMIIFLTTDNSLRIRADGVWRKLIPQGQAAGGDLTGNYPDPLIAAGAVTGSKIAQAGATTGQVLKWNGTTWSPAVDDNTGSLSSIGLTVPAPFTVSPATLTANGVFNVGMTSQAANTVFASPAAAAGTASFRQLVAADIPALDAGKITTGVLPLTRGGTGLTGIGAAGTVLTSNGTGLVYTAPASSAITLTGDVTGTGNSPVATTIAPQAVTFPKMQNISTQSLLGRYSNNGGSIEEISLNNSLVLTTGGVLYADSSKPIWNASRFLGRPLSSKVPASGEVLKWNGTRWESAQDNDGGATYGTLPGRDIRDADVAGSTTRMKIWASPVTGAVTNGVAGTTASSWNVLSFRGQGTANEYTTQLYFDKNTLAVKEWGGNTAPLTTNTGNGWYKALVTNGDNIIANGSIIFGGITSDASAEVTQDNNNLFWNNGNKRLGIGTNNPTASLDVDGTVKLGDDGTVLNGIMRFNRTFSMTDNITTTTPRTVTLNINGVDRYASVIVNPRTALPGALAIGSVRVTTANNITIVFINTNTSTANRTFNNITFDITVIQ